MWSGRSDTPWKNRYGLGWFIQDLEGSSSIEALGSTGGFVATLRYFPKEDAAVAVLLNHDFMLYPELFDQISRISLGKPWKPVLGEASEAVQSGFAAYAGTYKMEDGTFMVLRSENGGGFEFGDQMTGDFSKVWVVSETSGYIASQNALLQFRKSGDGGIEIFALHGNLAWTGRRTVTGFIRHAN